MAAPKNRSIERWPVVLRPILPRAGCLHLLKIPTGSDRTRALRRLFASRPEIATKWCVVLYGHLPDHYTPSSVPGSDRGCAASALWVREKTGQCVYGGSGGRTQANPP